MPIHTEKKRFVLAAGLLLLIACKENAPKENQEPQIKSAVAVAPTQDSATTTPAPPEAKPAEETAVATLRSAHYELQLFKAIAFLPKQNGTEEFKLKSGYRYLVLDLSVQNIAREKELDMGQVLLSAKLKDKIGRTFPLNAMAMAAFTIDNPDPQHQARYNAIWGRLKPGEVYRTKAIGFEVPEGAQKFTLSLNTDDNSSPQAKRQELTFSVE